MTDTRPNPRASLLRHRLMLPVLFIYLAVSAAIVSGTALWMKDLAETAVRERSTSTLNLVIENIRGELSKFIYMPKLLSYSKRSRALSRNRTAPSRSSSSTRS